MKPILVVDDDRSMAKTVCDILRRRGWAPTEVHSGEAAVRATKKRRYAAVLMDVKMPGMDGVEAFRAIQHAQPGTPVILMTAYAAPQILAQAEQEGVLRILPKPIPWHVLTTVLDEIRTLALDDDAEIQQMRARLQELMGDAGKVKAEDLKDQIEDVGVLLQTSILALGEQPRIPKRRGQPIDVPADVLADLPADAADFRETVRRAPRRPSSPSWGPRRACAPHHRAPCSRG